MSLGQLTKQFAKQAIGDSVKDMVDSLRPSDASALAESLPEHPAQAPGENVAAAIVGEVQAMQNALKEDQELIVLCSAGAETLRVFEFFTRSARVIVLTGIDAEKTITRVVCPAESLQLVCKPMAVKPETKPVRIRFVQPRPKPQTP